MSARIGEDQTSAKESFLGLALVVLLGSIEVCRKALRAVSLGETETEFGSLDDERAAVVLRMYEAAVKAEGEAQPVLREGVEWGQIFAPAFNPAIVREKFLAGIDDEDTRAVRAALDGGDSVLNAGKQMRGVQLFVGKMGTARYDTKETKVNTKGETVKVYAKRFTDEQVKDAAKMYRHLISEALNGGEDSAFDPFAFAAYLTGLTGTRIVARKNKKSGVVALRYAREGETESAVNTLTPMERLTKFVSECNGRVIPSAYAGVCFVSGLVLPAERAAVCKAAEAIGYTAEERQNGQIRVSDYRVPTTEARLRKSELEGEDAQTA